ncbi:MAG: amidohydrolase, partial [Thermoanaerobaculia bacterium]|nr:amidohydrolase [Thermoanaerobaculia bacterium]
PEEIVAAVARCAEERPGDGWITGGRWGSAVFPDTNPHKALLDAVAPDRPVILAEESGHAVWVNSKALELAGIDATTEAPPGGLIMRDADGEPTGTLKETAAALARAAVPPASPHQRQEAAAWAMRRLVAHGVTSMKDAWALRPSLEAYSALEDRGELPMRVATSIVWYSGADEGTDPADLLALRDEFASDRIATGFAKLMLDGVPTTSRTAAMLDPYLGESPEEAAVDRLLIDREALRDLVTRLDAEGVTVKMHAAGDASVRASLDAIEAARERNGSSGLPHEVGHAGFVHPDDLPRFAALGAVMEVSPYIWYPTPITDVAIREVVGEARMADFWPIRSGVDAGANVVAGSDWPVVPDLNPWRAMEAMVTREDPDAGFAGVLGPHQAVSVAQAIEILTRNGAVALRQDGRVGTLEVGKRADLVVLDRDLFAIPPHEIGETRVEMTVVDGEVVYERSDSLGSGG